MKQNVKKQDAAPQAVSSTEAFERALGTGNDAFCVLRLYVSGMTPNSSKAIENVKKLCEEQLAGRYELEIVDVYQQPLLAKEAQIVAVPTLVRVLPLPMRKFIGDMSQPERLLPWLGLHPKPAPAKSRQDLQAENQELSRRLEEVEYVQLAIQSGAVDALVVARPEGEQIFTLQGAEHPYRVLVETMNEGAATLGPNGAIVYCNQSLAAMLQIPLEGLIGSSLERHLAPACRPLAAVLAECARREDKVEISLLTGSGELLPVLFSCCGARPDGSLGMSVVFTDIAARKQAEQTILRLNRLYAVASALNHAIVHTNDRNAIFREFCRIAVELGGFRLAWVGLLDPQSGLVKVAAGNGETGYLKDLRIALDPEPEGLGPTAVSIREGTYCICNDFFKDGVTLPWQQRAHAHGLHSSASIAIKQNQEVIGALALYAEEKDFFDSQQVELLQKMGSDVSFALDNIRQTVLREEAERALRSETAERLQALEELRKNSLLLVQQSRMAALGEMIGNIAHQWRQPLNNLGLLVQQTPLFYELGEVDKAFLENNAEKSMQLIEHMSSTIDDFRNFFKPDKEKVDFKVSEELAKTLSLVEGSFQGQQIEIEVRDQSDPVIYGYPNEFAQVLLNILLNAKDALSEREIALPKVVVEITAEKNKAVLTVTDNAGGIPEEIIGKIFDPYFTTKGPQAGTGVGLFMSKTIIEKNMGGRLSARNVAGGAEFRIEI
jgi:signal transduction histidine kinase/PAS domain-containing protein